MVKTGVAIETRGFILCTSGRLVLIVLTWIVTEQQLRQAGTLAAALELALFTHSYNNGSTYFC